MKMMDGMITVFDAGTLINILQQSGVLCRKLAKSRDDDEEWGDDGGDLKFADKIIPL